MSESIQIKRIYDEPSSDDGLRVLVDGIWPRGISKEDARLDDWCKTVAPSSELRKWFDHDPERWDEFVRRYRKELRESSEPLQQLTEMAQDETLTLLFGARDRRYNQARVLKEVLEQRLEDTS
ncbi:MAG: DUF488 domain-containing protein [Wenzhouxiangellaceae bacterium]|nr:DUF488 domain-containing protein [Wenzhouxiangellaceae bacterium]